MPKTVTLLTDFGSQDPYVGEVKAVFLGVSGLSLIDLTHEIPSYSIAWGAFQLLRAYSRFPKGTIHLAVVDPGVGSERRAVSVKVGDYRFVGPDNGVLKWAVDEEVLRTKKKPEISVLPFAKDLDASTFHGRDVFAPFVVSLLKGKSPKLKKIERLEGREFPKPTELSKGVLQGEILGADVFGNVVTSIRYGKERSAEAELGWTREKIRSAESYSAIPKGNVALIRGSHGFWEIAAYQDSALKRGNLRVGERITVHATPNQTKQIK